MDLDKKEKIIILAIIAFTPIALGIILNIPGGSLTIGDENAWVGFFGNYSGGIIGGFVAFYIAKSQVKQEQYARLKDKENQEQEKISKHEEQEKYIKNIIELFLLDEITSNFRTLAKEKSYLEALERRAKGTINPSYTFNVPLHFDEFDRVRFELIKYNNQDVKDVIEFYRICKIISYEPDTSKMSKDDAESIVNVISKWNTKLNKKNG
ncbi:hypothetical protein [Oceanobacillus massiliensis]|uniref:hypothetical protein n=1 Tax=Oceanobacillus massiliensis TaxID=1465765 RepID=UPI003016231C